MKITIEDKGIIKSYEAVQVGGGSRFDLDEIAPVVYPPVHKTRTVVPEKGTLDAPKTISAIRDDINSLIRENSEGTLVAGLLTRLLGIVEQLAMKIEQLDHDKQPVMSWVYRPNDLTFIPNPQPYIPPTIAPSPFSPSRPYIGDPIPFPGGSTICGTASSQSYQAKGESVAQADGMSNIVEVDSWNESDEDQMGKWPVR